MSFPQRLLVFCVGVGLGAIIAFYILRNRGLERPEGPPESAAQAEIEAVPAIMDAYQERQRPLQSPFIAGEFTQPGAQSGTYRRVLVLEGRQPGQRLRIVENQYAEADGTLKVDAWRIMAAGRVVVEIEAGTKAASLREPLAALGYRLLRKAAKPDHYVVAINAYEPESVDRAMEQIAALGPPVVKVSPDYLDKRLASP